MRVCGLCLFLLIVIFNGCSKDEPAPIQIVAFNVAFDSPSKIDIKENDPTELEIPIKLEISQEEDLSVAFEIFNQDVATGSDFTLLSQSPIVIAAGSLSGSVRLKVNDNEVVQSEDRKIYLRIRSVDAKGAKIATPKEVVITIVENDCAASVTQVEPWFGSLQIVNESEVSSAVGGENVAGLCSGKLDVQGKFLGNENPESKLTIELSKSTPESNTGGAEINRTKLFSFTSQFEIEATGTYDEVARKIVLNYFFFDLNNSANNFEATLTVSPE